MAWKKGDAAFLRQSDYVSEVEIVATPDGSQVLVKMKATQKYDKVPVKRLYTSEALAWEALDRQRIPPATTFGRRTRCWECHEELSTQTHETCSVCGWLICDRGHCRQGCQGATTRTVQR